jgi:type VI secretion system protein VasD
MVIYPSSGMRFHLASLVSLFRWLPAGLMALALGGCGSIPMPFKPDPTLIEAKAVASPQANPDARKRASPVVVRVYELKSRAQFDATDFISLFDHDKDVLGAEMVSREEFVLRPGESKDIEKQTAPDTKFLAVLVGYRNLEKSRPKAIIAIEPNIKNRWVIQIDALSVSILPAPAKK